MMNGGDRDIHSDANFNNFVSEKISKAHKIIQNIASAILKHKNFGLFSNCEFNICNNNLSELCKRIKQFETNYAATNEKNISQNETLSEMQKIFDKLSILLAEFGTNNVDDIFYVTFGKDYCLTSNRRDIDEELFLSKFELIKNHTSYVGYKAFNWKIAQSKQRIDTNKPELEELDSIHCLECDSFRNSFLFSVHGIRIIVQNEVLKKTLILYGFIDNINIEWLVKEKYISSRNAEIVEYVNNHPQNIDKTTMLRMVNAFTLKDYLLYSNGDIHKKYNCIMIDIKNIKSSNLNSTIKKFLDMDLLHQRNLLIHLLTYENEHDIHYVAYILYDLLTCEKTIDQIDKTEIDRQTIIYDSFPWKIKIYFKGVMKNTIQYSNEMSNKYDVNRVSLEQQIILLKANDRIKDKAMEKLKEIKGRPDDQANKAKQYLEGLMRIPFQTYRREPILCKMEEINEIFRELLEISAHFEEPKQKYTIFEISKITEKIENKLISDIIDYSEKTIPSLSKTKLVDIARHIKKIDNHFDVSISTANRTQLIHVISKTISNFSFALKLKINNIIDPNNPHSKIESKIATIKNEISSIQSALIEINSSLEESIYAHQGAKSQILKIISQWITGEQTGYCFGFEGSPGIGKTSLAKRGLSNCLKDENGNPRPFAFIALGGSCNGSTLEGHNYTYVNSSWGKIVDILMDAKCMNPIIYIDELDKVSKTEQGREIISILTHAIDSTQNSEFQDKYFNGIPIDLSKVLFIFSYNDPDQIDHILLDRIHRVKFDNLSWDDKIVIAKDYILPEMNKKLGFENTVVMPDETIEYMIDTYTMEPGVRKLKETLFDLYGEINMELLDTTRDYKLPIIIDKDCLGKTYLKKYKKMSERKIHSDPKIGIINGLWASSTGKGGIIPIECAYFPSERFLDLHLTGMQGDVMKESMNVAKTLAWALTSREAQNKIVERSKMYKQGIHVHCPEGAVSKDGPSAGLAISLAIYSLFNNRKIKNQVAITGEITLQGNVLAIGGLDIKIIGGIRSGVKTFLYPIENKQDFEECNRKYGHYFEKSGIKFIPINTINEAMPYIFE